MAAKKQKLPVDKLTKPELLALVKRCAARVTRLENEITRLKNVLRAAEEPYTPDPHSHAGNSQPEPIDHKAIAAAGASVMVDRVEAPSQFFPWNDALPNSFDQEPK